jgi:hypothetical protein
MTRIFISILLLIAAFAVHSQGPSLSPDELKDSFFERKNAALQNGTKSISQDDQNALNRIETMLFENAPNSYAYYFVKYDNNKYKTDVESYLLKAASLKPDEKEIQFALYLNYVRKGDTEMRKVYAKTIMKYLSNDIQIYMKSIVLGLPVKTLVFSNELDASPFLVLQDMGQIDQDIEVIVLDFMLDKTYWKKLGSTYKLGNLKFENNEALLMKSLMSKSPTTTFVSSTVHAAYFNLIANQITLAGLVYQLNCPNQVTALTAFWTNAKQDFKRVDFESRKDKVFFVNYLPPLLTLYKLKLLRGVKDDALRKDLVDFAARINKKEQVISILKEYDQLE